MLEITLLSNGNIQLVSPGITQMIADQANYTRVKIEATINCCPELYSQESLFSAPDTTYFVVLADSIQVKPGFFASTPLKDGVYHFDVKAFKNDNTYTYEENCSFIDITYKCKVAATIKTLLDKSEDGLVASNVHVLHYALTNGSNCGCNCTEMCNIFRELTKLIIPVKLQNQSCGC
jgi:hypothetical protein